MGKSGGFRFSILSLSFLWLIAINLLLITSFPASAQQGDPCPRGALAQHDKNNPPDLVISEVCHVKAGGQFFYGNVNIIQGGRLVFDDPPDATPSDFWARSIIVENQGLLLASGDKNQQPYGEYGSILTIHLYGRDQSNGDPDKTPGMGALCKTEENADIGPCGIPMEKYWLDNGANERVLPGKATALGGELKDYFYRYGPLRGDNLCNNGDKWGPKVRDDKTPKDAPYRCDERADKKKPSSVKVAYFGYKVLALSYGGQLILNGRVGRCYDPGGWYARWDSCVTAWGRLAKSIDASDKIKIRDFEVETNTINGPYISKGDEIVVTSTDYLPGHSETFEVEDVTRQPWTRQHPGLEKIRVKLPAKFPHNGERYSLVDRLKAANGRLASLDQRQVNEGAETRAAVGILNRSVRIVSAGDNPGDDFPDSPSKDGTKCRIDPNTGGTDGKGPCYSFGGHMVIRQGFATAYVTGVEFKQMGQGGRLAHYPIHFHMARKVPYETTIASNSIDESMTRWIVLHSTLGVRVANNVGYKSIGHGFYLEDGTETGNIFDENLGVFARAAIDNDQNPRKIAGILSDNQDPAVFAKPNVANQGFPYRSDSEYPSVFWITNGWNAFTGNMAAGAGTCGACYWLVPAANSAMADVPDDNGAMQDMKWSGYAGLQKDRDFAGTTPLKSFEGNFCTSAMMAFQTTPDGPDCSGTAAANVANPQYVVVKDIKSLAPAPARHEVKPVDAPPHTEPDPMADMYYPRVIGARKPTLCNKVGQQDPELYDCSGVKICSAGNLGSCAVTVLDHFTSSFNWAAGAVSAVWLRPLWYLVDNSVFTDVQNAALTFVSGGDFTHSSLIPGYWTLARNSIFVGHTQDQKTGNPFASDAGPFNKRSELKCDDPQGKGTPNYCVSTPEGVTFPVSSFFNNQRMFNIYDGPAYEDTNAFLDITTTDCANGVDNGCMYGTSTAPGVPKIPGTDKCYLPNAAIAWKQPNGFFYPPAFHSRNLFFGNVDIRHYVIDPLFKPNTYISDDPLSAQIYCFANGAKFNGFTGIDRQTELNDDDGSLTGLSNTLLDSRVKQTISVNEDPFFTAPVETPECLSNIGPNGDPKNACVLPKNPPVQAPVTAKTSPYDYVATVVYHPERVVDKKDMWSKDCTNPMCYGVPLFRQDLAGVDGGSAEKSTREWVNWYRDPGSKENCGANANTPGCRWPFIRMAGAAIATRETLTVNGGAYYIDTTVPRDMQEKEVFNQQGPALGSLTSSYNVFEPNESYTVFFLYLKNTTHQTYRIYVGKDFADDGIRAVQVGIPDSTLKVNPLSPMPSWLTVDRSAVKTTGVLTVNLAFGPNDISLLAPSPSNGMCQPHEFCRAQGNQCVGNVSERDPRFWVVGGHTSYGPQEANAICSQWAVKDLDCPPSGCLGFQFTLPPKFVADATAAAPSPHRPRPQMFPTSTIQFERTSTVPDKAPGGACHYPLLPVASDPKDGQCLVP
jgi:cell migration-inducing and hyaluronan-binding protein